MWDWMPEAPGPQGPPPLLQDAAHLSRRFSKRLLKRGSHSRLFKSVGQKILTQRILGIKKISDLAAFLTGDTDE